MVRCTWEAVMGERNECRALSACSWLLDRCHWGGCRVIGGGAALALMGACSMQPAMPERQTVDPAAVYDRPPIGETIIVPAAPVCAADNPFCAPSDAPPEQLTNAATEQAPGGPANAGGKAQCASQAQPIDLQPAGVNIMLAVDGSASMAKHWPRIQTALRSLRANNPTASFGMHVFWADPIDTSSFGAALEDAAEAIDNNNNACTEVHNERLDLGDHSAEELVTFLGDGPRGGTIRDRYQVSAVIEPLNHYLTTLTGLVDPKRTNYLVIFTGGNDNCFGSAFVTQPDKIRAYQKLALELSRNNIRVIPVGLDAPEEEISDDDNWFNFDPGIVGRDIPNITTDYRALETLRVHGGGSLGEVPRIDTDEKLAELVAEVGRTVTNCRFMVPEALDASKSVNAFELRFTINGRAVPRDRFQEDGWDFVDGRTDQVEFFGDGCEALQSGLFVEADKSCERELCGNAAVSVSTKPRVVLLLLDASASRIECESSDFFDCILTNRSATDRPLTYWEIVQRAVGDALVSPVNKGVSFGMQFFPGKTEALLSCEVAPEPEIPPGPRQEIDIMKAMLEKLPFGLSPVVQVMESVAAAPGQLADPNAVGAVVLLSDGGDNCSGDEQPEIVARLGAAAATLQDAGVLTFGVRYGSMQGRTPEGDEQLTAVVTHGGTARTQQDAPYVDAKSPEELAAALAGISDRLASCSFELGDVDADVDRDRTTLFMDGEQVGFDATGGKQSGWGWLDPERTGIELHGDACTTFKSSPKTNIVVEFGCEPVTVPPPPPDPPPPPPLF